MTLFLQPEDGPAYEIYNANKTSRYVLIADHARNRVPQALGNLGVASDVLAQHVGYDIGAEGMARHVADLMGAPLVIAGFSRLVLDPNRVIGDPGQIPTSSDGIVIPANQNLSEADKQGRIDELFTPYQAAIAAALAAVRARGETPILLSLHSFTPQLSVNGAPRPWHIGVLWREDERLSRPLISALQARGDIVVGDNQPYDRRDLRTQSVEVHGEETGTLNTLVEVRQDLITDSAGQQRWRKSL